MTKRELLDALEGFPDDAVVSIVVDTRKGQHQPDILSIDGDEQIVIGRSIRTCIISPKR